MKHFLLFFFILHFLASEAEQNYSGNSVLSCRNSDENGPSSAFLYTCNGLNKSCGAFLIFKSQPPYNTVPAISNLTSSNPEELAIINDATMLTVFPTGKEVIVPVNCSCRTNDYYYQAEAKYTLFTIQTYFTIANDTYQGLSTCDALKRYNSYGELDLKPGIELHVPLRCACPTMFQTDNGTRFLVTYPVDWGDSIDALAARFKVNSSSLLDATVFTTSTLFPFTTILIPLRNEPDSSITITHHGQPKFVSPPPVSRKSNSRTKLYVAVGTTGGFVGVVCVILCSVFMLRKRSATARLVEAGKEGKTKWATSEDIREEIASIEHVSKEYRFKEIKEATENFSSKNRINGCVYKGVFGKDVFAVKRMRADASKEVNLLKKINHFNLIKLQGYCENEGFFYLVFEYMENGSLREWLEENMSRENQGWGKRIQIALDIANGLQYLHDFTEPSYVHKDIKSSNILLNKNLRAKIANFSLAKELEGEKTCTTHVMGTRGYMAPEYLYTGMVSPYMDVYAFGVVVLELVTGKDSVFIQDGREVKLSAVIVPLMGKQNAEENLSSLLDPSLLTGNNEKVLAVELAELGVACLMQEPASRPSMAEIVSTLLKIHASVHPRTLLTTHCNSLRLER